MDGPCAVWGRAFLSLYLKLMEEGQDRSFVRKRIIIAVTSPFYLAFECVPVKFVTREKGN